MKKQINPPFVVQHPTDGSGLDGAVVGHALRCVAGSCSGSRAGCERFGFRTGNTRHHSILGFKNCYQKSIDIFSRFCAKKMFRFWNIVLHIKKSGLEQG